MRRRHNDVSIERKAAGALILVIMIGLIVLASQ